MEAFMQTAKKCIDRRRASMNMLFARTIRCNEVEHARNNRDLWHSRFMKSLRILRNLNPWLDGMEKSGTRLMQRMRCGGTNETGCCWTIRLRSIPFSLNAHDERGRLPWKLLNSMWSNQTDGFIQPFRSRAFYFWCANATKLLFPQEKWTHSKVEWFCELFASNIFFAFICVVISRFTRCVFVFLCNILTVPRQHKAGDYSYNGFFFSDFLSVYFLLSHSHAIQYVYRHWHNHTCVGTSAANANSRLTYFDVLCGMVSFAQSMWTQHDYGCANLFISILAWHNNEQQQHMDLNGMHSCDAFDIVPHLHTLRWA